ncbi:MAG TPA: 16S rRNA (uracil(1498)-N(3))-methyltransferase [Thermoanaerobaculia bacterium]|nr:16S rRNA (uracil(1498)-N(3))-methyltransferase [Thermoanaerobaculia bacterium]
MLSAGWKPVGLGPRILRIETAAVAGAAMLLLKSAN